LHHRQPDHDGRRGRLNPNRRVSTIDERPSSGRHIALFVVTSRGGNGAPGWDWETLVT
jgi:hypothetical protein